jgi:hypothetical protein
MATWYVRPNTSHSGTRNGTSYATAWGGWSEIVWGVSGVNAGDTLYICGAHAYTSQTTIGAHGATSDANRVTIRGDYAADPGSIAYSGASWMDAFRSYTSIVNLRITSTASGYNCIYQSASAGFVLDGCTLIGGDSGIVLGSGTAFTSITIRNNTMYGQTVAGINQSITTGSIVSAGVNITGNTVHDTSLYGIQLSIASSAWTTSSFRDYLIANNIVYNTPGPSIYLRTCHNDTTTNPTIYSGGLVVSGNTIHDCGTIAGDNGKHGGILVMGFAAPMISNNVVRDCYVLGAGIQTAKNKQPRVIFNRVTGIRSGTDTASFQGGFPIDGNGIFFDNLTIDGLGYGNYVADLISTGDPNSGCGLAFWTATGSKYIGNIVKDCNRGTFFGRVEETGNHVLNNTFINCNAGVWKVGTNALTGNITVKNNIFHNCPTGFSAGSNPSITADYNCIHGATNKYIGISAGANDISVDPQLDADYRPQAAALKRAGANLGGMDYYGKAFYAAPNIGAVDDLTTTPRYALAHH